MTPWQLIVLLPGKQLLLHALRVSPLFFEIWPVEQSNIGRLLRAIGQGPQNRPQLHLQEAISAISRTTHASETRHSPGASLSTPCACDIVAAGRRTRLANIGTHRTYRTPPASAPTAIVMEHPLAAVVPPIPRKSRERERTRQPRDQASRRREPPNAALTVDTDDVFADWSARDRELYADRYLRDHDDDQTAPVAPASPEVISSLITSLSAISRPVSNHFDGPSYLSPVGLGSPLNLSLPGSPTGGSFGVDYGAYAQPSLKELREEDVALEDLPASPPVVRTSKPPSGLSALTSPQSPKSPGTRDASGGLKGLLSRASSRPSSRGSLTSGAESIGKPSIERLVDPLSPGAESNPRKQKSYDSWGRKGTRNQRGVMYMSSKEQLREKEAEKKRASIGAVGGSSNGFVPTSGPTTPRLDPLSAESVISEEPNAYSATTRLVPEIPNGSLPSPGMIPVRDSSLRKTGNNAKRSSARTSRTSKRDSDGAYGTIPEVEELSGGTRGSRGDSPKKRHSGQKQGQRVDPLRLSADLSQEGPTPLGKPRPDVFTTSPSTPAAAMFPDLDAVDDGAPSPAVAQSRRRDREASAEYRRRSGRHTPDPLGGYVSEGGGTSVKVKRSSTRLKRLSGAASPTPEKGAEQGPGGNSQSDQPHIAYERPRSADSIDDAVESYLRSPRLSQKIRHPQTGRVISFSEVGDPNGSAVFCCVGMGLTRYITAFYDELALTLKLRLITPDRPGVGDSEPYSEGTATPLGWPGMLFSPCSPARAVCRSPLTRGFQMTCTPFASLSRSPSSPSWPIRRAPSMPWRRRSACPSISVAGYICSRPGSRRLR